jgi:hypothetical protein
MDWKGVVVVLIANVTAVLLLRSRLGRWPWTGP